MSPVYWQHDQAMRLYPLPDLIIVADHQVEPFQEKLDLDSMVVNPVQ